MLVVTGEFDALARLRAKLPSGPAGETWIGDDAAVVRMPEGRWLLLAADTVVVGVHADLTLTGLDDLGWKAMVANLSDLAAMGGRPAHALVTVAGPVGTDLDRLYDGIGAAAHTYRCPVVGGDLTNAADLVVTVAVTGTVDGDPVRRDGARPGDSIWVTAPLGASAAGLRVARNHRSSGCAVSAGHQQLINAHARPTPAMAAGHAARIAGATAMIDVSDGLAADLGHVADASGVGVALDWVPIAAGATSAEALGGGEDYALVFCAPDRGAVEAAFADLPPPLYIGACTANPRERILAGIPLATAGWEHTW